MAVSTGGEESSSPAPSLLGSLSGMGTSDRMMLDAASDMEAEALPEGWALWPLLALPMGFLALNLSLEFPDGGVVGGLAVVLWHACFWMVSVLGGRASTATTGLLLAAALAAPLLLETNVVVRQIHALAWITHALRVFTIRSEADKYDARSWQARVAFVHFYHNLVHTTKASTESVAMGALPRLALSGLMIATCVRLLKTYLGPPGSSAIVAALDMDHAPVYLSRWFIATTCFFFGVLAVDDLYRMFLGLLKVAIPSTFRDPFRSHTVSEFWSERWNLVIQQLLKDGVTKPLRRRGYSRRVAMLATFFASGLLHVVPLHMSPRRSTWGTLSMVLFFIVQVAFISAEHTWGVRGRVWLAVCWLASVGLFLEPILHIADL